MGELYSLEVSLNTCIFSFLWSKSIAIINNSSYNNNNDKLLLKEEEFILAQNTAQIFHPMRNKTQTDRNTPLRQLQVINSWLLYCIVFFVIA